MNPGEGTADDSGGKLGQGATRDLPLRARLDATRGPFTRVGAAEMTSTTVNARGPRPLVVRGLSGRATDHAPRTPHHPDGDISLARSALPDRAAEDRRQDPTPVMPLTASDCGDRHSPRLSGAVPASNGGERGRRVTGPAKC
jgi:hypothetical protein